MNKRSWFAGLVAAGLLGTTILSAACVSPDPTSQSNSDLTSAKTDPSKTKSPTPSASSSASASGGAGTTTPPPSTGGTAAPAGSDQACASQQSDACLDCCVTNHPTGSDTEDEAESTCICAPTRCATECGASFCSDNDNAPDPTPGDACDTCMKKYENDDGTGECDKAMETALKAAGGDSAAYLACQNNCP